MVEWNDLLDRNLYTILLSLFFDVAIVNSCPREYSETLHTSKPYPAEFKTPSILICMYFQDPQTKLQLLNPQISLLY